MKKLFALLLALVLVLGLATTAFAADATTKITINDKSTYTGDRTYAGYKLLNASVSGSDYAYQLNTKYEAILKTVLNLATTATETEIITAIQAKSSAEDILHLSTALYKAIKAGNVAADESWTVTASDKTHELAQGYWLIADVTDLQGTGYSNSLVMVDTVGDNDVTITNKPDDPTGEKKSDDEDDSVLAPVVGNEDGTEWVEVTDHDIGDSVPFHIAGTLPNNIAAYDYYMFKIGDKVQQGLTFEPDSFAITVNGKTRTIGKQGTAGVDFWYDIVTTTEGDVQTAQELYVYPAHSYTTHTLNEATTTPTDDYIVKEASKDNGGDFLKLFAAGTDHSEINSSTFNFTYTCKLNENAVTGKNGNPNEFTLYYSNDPFGDSTGKSKPQTTITLTYKTIFNKVDGEGNKLEGADFDVYKFVADPDVTDEQKTNAVELVDLKTAAETDAAATNKTVIHHPGANAYGILVKLTNKQTNETTTTKATTFTFNGMDAGYYRLVETVTPKGYNGIDPIDFHVVADHDTAYVANDDALNALSVVTRIPGQMSMEADLAAGSLTATIENHSGDELPSTGGIGTTIFYILGSIMVVGAAVILVTKKRMAA